MEFILYDILLNVFDVDEAYEANAKIDHKFIVISTPGDKFRNFQDDKFLFDFFRDDTFKYHSSEKVNTRIRVFSNQDTEAYNDYYAHLNWINYFILSWRFKKLWLLKKDSIMWVINLLVAISSIILSTYVALQLNYSRTTQKIELTNPIMINDQQIIKLLETINNDKLISLDSLQLDRMIKDLKTHAPIKVVLDKQQLENYMNSIKLISEKK